MAIPRTSVLAGAMLAVMAAIAFTLISVIVKLLSGQLGASELVFFRFMIGLILIVPFVLADKDFKPRIQHPLPYILRIVSSLLAIGLVFYVVKFLPLTDAILFNNTAPLTLMQWVTPSGAKARLLVLALGLTGMFDWLIWGMVPSRQTLCGGAIIIVGVMITLFGGHHVVNPQPPSGKHHG